MRIDLGAVTIDDASRELTRAGAPAHVEPQVFDLIIYLVRNRDRVVSKDELVDEIWAGRAISDATLASCVKSARRALGDDGQAQSMIRTLQRRGFRYVGPAGPDAAEETAASTPESVAIMLGGGESAELAAGAADLDLTPPAGPSIAVLPFDALDGSAEPSVLASGLRADITTRLARTRSLFVTGRDSAARFRLKDSSPAAIGAALGVRYLLHGALMQSSDRFRLNVALTATETGYEVWAETFDRSLDDLFAVQDEICDLVVSGVEGGVALKERQAAALRPIASLDAWGAYHRATDLLFRYAPDARAEARRLLDRAAAADPGSARIAAAQSFLMWQEAFFETSGDRDGDARRALDLAEHAVALDPLDPLGRYALGRAARLIPDLDYSMEELRAAVTLNPSFAAAHYAYGSGLKFLSRAEEGIVSVERARRISPYDPMMFSFMSLLAELNGLLGEAAASVKWAKRAARSPQTHYNILAIAAWCHWRAGETDAAQVYLAEVRRRRPGYSRAMFFRAFPYRAPERGMLDALLGDMGLPK